MNIALIGFGSMGRRIKEIAEERGHKIVAVIDTHAASATASEITRETLGGADIAIDFTHPSTALDNINRVLSAKTSLVIGTTGWYENLSAVRTTVVTAGVGFLWSANFSIGVNVYLKIIEKAAHLIDNYDEYDVWGNEIHHHNKADSPSGTARALEKILLANIRRKTSVVEEKLDRKIEPHEIHFSSTRGGPVNFAHTIGFDSSADTISITHSARNRDGYALGAVRAAEWLNGKAGFFAMEDFINSRTL